MSYLLFFGLIPPIILLIYIYKLDKIEKEPPRMILRLFLFGIFSVTLYPFDAAKINRIVIGGRD